MNYSEDEIREFVEQLKGYYNANKKRISIKKMADEIEIGKSTLEEYLYRGRLPEKNLEKIIVYLDKKDVNIDNFNFTNNNKFHQERTEERNLNKQFDENNPIFKELLETNESIRDPVHGDIGITLLEKSLINLNIFQRLRGIYQLGPTHMVYPGATHTRFLHSVGTLHVASKLIHICNKNYKRYNQKYIVEIINYHKLLIRLSALLHDLSHIPHGHILEDEGNLFPSQWENDERKKIFEGGSEIYNCINEIFLKFNLPEHYCAKICEDLMEILITNKKEYKPRYVVDIVSDTLCADLLDYSQRDTYYCGLSERWGDRFINYFAILSLKKIESDNPLEPESEIYKPDESGKGELKLVLLAYRYEQDPKNPRNSKKKYVPKRDVISEAIDILRKRHSLGEKVYYHKTKLAASSMLISAVASALKDGKLKSDELFELNDDEFITTLKNKDDRTNYLLESYKSRNLYKPIYQLSYIDEEDYKFQSYILWREIFEKYRDYNERIKIEKQLENEFKLLPGSVSIYCPNKAVNAKKFEAFVHPREKSSVKSLRYILDSSRRKEIEVIENKFKSLWNFMVFVDPKQIDPDDIHDVNVREFTRLCENIFRLPNEKPNSNEIESELEDIFSERLINRKASEWDKEHPDMKIPNYIVEELKTSANRPQTQVEIDEYIENLIEEKVISHYRSLN